MNTVFRFVRLPLGEQLRLSKLVALRAAIEPLLAAVPLPRLARMLGVRVATDGAAPLPRLSADALSPADLRALAAVHRLTRRGRRRDRRCLRHALLAGSALRRHRPVLRIGAASRDGALAAHAWLEVLGGRIDTGDATDYTPLRGTRRT